MKSRLFISVLLGVLPLLYRHASAQAIEVTSTGNVGIGTMTPDSKLHVSGGHLNIDNSYAIAWGGGTGRPAIFGDKISGALSFYTNGWETVRVTNTGNVGIGTSNPAAKLTVVGDVYSASASTVGAGTNFSTITASSTSSSLYLVRSVGTWSDTWWQWTHDTGNKLKLGFSSVPQAEFSNGLAVFLGNVGIGTTSPSHKLTVVGSVRAASFVGDVNSYADFVFKPDYKLASLAEVEASINANGHLPDIPSEAEVKRDGLDVVGM